MKANNQSSALVSSSQVPVSSQRFGLVTRTSKLRQQTLPLSRTLDFADCGDEENVASSRHDVQEDVRGALRVVAGQKPSKDRDVLSESSQLGSGSFRNGRSRQSFSQQSSRSSASTTASSGHGLLSEDELEEPDLVDEHDISAAASDFGDASATASSSGSGLQSTQQNRNPRKFQPQERLQSAAPAQAIRSKRRDRKAIDQAEAACNNSLQAAGEVSETDFRQPSQLATTQLGKRGRRRNDENTLAPWLASSATGSLDNTSSSEPNPATTNVATSASLPRDPTSNQSTNSDPASSELVAMATPGKSPRTRSSTRTSVSTTSSNKSVAMTPIPKASDEANRSAVSLTSELNALETAQQTLTPLELQQESPALFDVQKFRRRTSGMPTATTTAEDAKENRQVDLKVTVRNLGRRGPLIHTPESSTEARDRSITASSKRGSTSGRKHVSRMSRVREVEEDQNDLAQTAQSKVPPIPSEEMLGEMRIDLGSVDQVNKESVLTPRSPSMSQEAVKPQRLMWDDSQEHDDNESSPQTPGARYEPEKEIKPNLERREGRAKNSINGKSPTERAPSSSLFHFGSPSFDATVMLSSNEPAVFELPKPSSSLLRSSDKLGVKRSWAEQAAKPLAKGMDDLPIADDPTLNESLLNPFLPVVDLALTSQGLLTSSDLPQQLYAANAPVELDRQLRAQIGVLDGHFRARYGQIKHLSAGAFGDVFLVRNRLDGCLYAVKRLKATTRNVGERRRALAEAYVLAALWNRGSHFKYIDHRETYKSSSASAAVAGGNKENEVKPTGQAAATNDDMNAMLNSYELEQLMLAHKEWVERSEPPPPLWTAHPGLMHIVRYVESWCESDGSVYIAFEFCPGGSLAGKLSQFARMHEGYERSRRKHGSIHAVPALDTLGSSPGRRFQPPPPPMKGKAAGAPLIDVKLNRPLMTRAESLIGEDQLGAMGNKPGLEGGSHNEAVGTTETEPTSAPPVALMDPAELLSLALQMSQALALLHARNIAHMDVKPENILIAAPGVYRLADFGLARAFPNRAIMFPGMMGSVENSPNLSASQGTYSSPAIRDGDQIPFAKLENPHFSSARFYRELRLQEEHCQREFPSVPDVDLEATQIMEEVPFCEASPSVRARPEPASSSVTSPTEIVNHTRPSSISANLRGATGAQPASSRCAQVSTTSAASIHSSSFRGVGVPPSIPEERHGSPQNELGNRDGKGGDAEDDGPLDASFQGTQHTQPTQNTQTIQSTQTAGNFSLSPHFTPNVHPSPATFSAYRNRLTLNHLDSSQAQTQTQTQTQFSQFDVRTPARMRLVFESESSSSQQGQLHDVSQTQVYSQAVEIPLEGIALTRRPSMPDDRVPVPLPGNLTKFELMKRTLDAESFKRQTTSTESEAAVKSLAPLALARKLSTTMQEMHSKRPIASLHQASTLIRAPSMWESSLSSGKDETVSSLAAAAASSLMRSMSFQSLQSKGSYDTASTQVLDKSAASLNQLDTDRSVLSDTNPTRTAEISVDDTVISGQSVARLDACRLSRALTYRSAMQLSQSAPPSKSEANAPSAETAQAEQLFRRALFEHLSQKPIRGRGRGLPSTTQNTESLLEVEGDDYAEEESKPTSLVHEFDTLGDSLEPGPASLTATPLTVHESSKLQPQSLVLNPTKRVKCEGGNESVHGMSTTGSIMSSARSSLPAVTNHISTLVNTGSLPPVALTLARTLTSGSFAKESSILGKPIERAAQEATPAAGGEMRAFNVGDNTKHRKALDAMFGESAGGGLRGLLSSNAEDQGYNLPGLTATTTITKDVDSLIPPSTHADPLPLTGLTELAEESIEHDVFPEDVLREAGAPIQRNDVWICSSGEGDRRYLALDALEKRSSSQYHPDKIDMFALGMTLYELASCRPLPQNGDEWFWFRNQGWLRDTQGKASASSRRDPSNPLLPDLDVLRPDFGDGGSAQDSTVPSSLHSLVVPTERLSWNAVLKNRWTCVRGESSQADVLTEEEIKSSPYVSALNVVIERLLHPDPIMRPSAAEVASFVARALDPLTLLAEQRGLDLAVKTVAYEHKLQANARMYNEEVSRLRSTIHKQEEEIARLKEQLRLAEMKHKEK